MGENSRWLSPATATGAGSAAENAIRIGVGGSMLAAKLIDIFLVPPLFVSVMWVFDRRRATPNK